jgi:DOPA 4,5-dioxygenase
MLNSELAVNSKLMPAQCKREFDAHIYYVPSSRSRADALRLKAEKRFEGQPIFVGRMVDQAVGPHPVPMFEINFAKEFLGEVCLWFIDNRDDLSILVHQVTGDDPVDHTAGAIWLGQQVELDMTKLDPSPVKTASETKLSEKPRETSVEASL